MVRQMNLLAFWEEELNSLNLLAMRFLDPVTSKIWNTISNEMLDDGLVCDIKIRNTNLDDWIQFFSLVAQNLPHKHSIGKSLTELPTIIKNDFFQTDELHWLQISIGNFTVECPILDSEMIELHTDPSSIVETDQLELLFEFLRELGSKIGKQIEISAEAAPMPALLFLPNIDKFTPGPLS